MALPAAGGPAIFRASQKDEYFTKQLSGSASEVLRLFGNRRWNQYSKYVPLAAHLAYNSITTLRDFQTLGEEYTGIVQVDDTYVKIPSKILQVLCILLGTFGENFLRSILLRVKEKTAKNVHLLPHPKKMLLKVISIADWSIPVLRELHQACFFLGAQHYHIPKRISSINYVNAVPGRQPRVSTLRTLGIPYLMRAILSAVRSPPSFDDIDAKEKPAGVSKKFESCSGCLEDNTTPCALPCGHIFCNSCCRSSKSCALCRAPYNAHRAVALQNYSLKTIS